MRYLISSKGKKRHEIRKGQSNFNEATRCFKSLFGKVVESLREMIYGLSKATLDGSLAILFDIFSTENVSPRFLYWPIAVRHKKSIFNSTLMVTEQNETKF